MDEDSTTEKQPTHGKSLPKRASDQEDPPSESIKGSRSFDPSLPDNTYQPLDPEQSLSGVDHGPEMQADSTHQPLAPEQELSEQLSAPNDPAFQPRKLSFGWRVFVFLTVALAGGAGGAVGAAVARLGCEDCGSLAGITGAVLGALFAGIGMTVLAVLVARSFEEWKFSKKSRSE